MSTPPSRRAQNANSQKFRLPRSWRVQKRVDLRLDLIVELLQKLATFQGDLERGHRLKIFRRKLEPVHESLFSEVIHCSLAFLRDVHPNPAGRKGIQPREHMREQLIAWISVVVGAAYIFPHLRSFSFSFSL